MNKNAIVVGRHAPDGLPYNVIEQRNVTFENDVDAVIKQIEELFATAYDADAVLLFQAVPGILACALTRIALRNAPTHLKGAGVVISKPGERPAGKIIEASHSVFADDMTRENIEHWLSHVLTQVNPNVRFADGNFVVDPPMKFIFDKVEWLF